MGTIIRPELSVNNQFWVEKHRYYELKHFCLQYPLWKRAYADLNEAHYQQQFHSISYSKTNDISNPTADMAEMISYYTERIQMVEQTAKEAASDFSWYLLKGVTEGVSYDILKALYNIPCCKDIYYESYRKFFYLLSKVRN